MEREFMAEAQALIATMGGALLHAAPLPEEFDWPEPAEGAEGENVLYDSTRDYLDQVDIFRAYQGKHDDVGFAADRIVTKTCEQCGTPFTTSERELKKKYCTIR